jgi:hypothetical protein
MKRAKDWSNEIPSVGIKQIDGKPALRVPGDGLLLSEFAAALGEQLRHAGVFARGGCAFTLDHQGQRLEPVTPRWLRTWIEKHVVPYKMKAGRSGITFDIKQSITDDVAQAVNVSPQFLSQLPRVERFNPCQMPVLRSDQSIELLPVGMDKDSATYTANAGFTLQLMPVEYAREVLLDLLDEFAWPNDGGRSIAVHISAMMTVFAGGILPPGTVIPVFLYLANSEGAGKTLLASLAGITYAEAPSAEPAPKDEAEWQKKLLALTMSGRRLVLLDNLKGHLDSAALEAYATSPTFGGRILGVTKEFSGDAGATLLVTGNRLTISADMDRRSLVVELFMPELRAKDRTFRRILDAETVRELRPRVVSALWSLVKAWDHAGRPPCSHSNASFPRWAQTVAGVVEFAGFGSPLVPSAIADMGDTDGADFSTLVKSMNWGKRYSFEELVAKADEGGLFERLLSDRDRDDSLSRRAKSAFGKLLTRYRGRCISSSGDIFAVEGKGRERRFAILRSHGRHGLGGISPSLENAPSSYVASGPRRP